MTPPIVGDEDRLSVLIAVDGGNTKTDALALLKDGTILGWGQAGNSDIYATEGSRAAAELHRAIALALGGAAIGWPDIGHISLRLAGIDWPDDTAFWAGILRQWGYRGSQSLLNDGFAGIRLGTLDGIGLAIVAGTYSGLAARGPHGVEFGLSMWSQHYMGGFGFGEGAYRAVMLADLGMAAETRLSESLPAFFAVEGVPGLLRLFSSRDGHRSNRILARAAPIVTEEAKSGDAVALGIIAEQASLFSSYAVAVAKRAGFDQYSALPVAIGGSVARAEGSPFGDLLIARLTSALPGCRITSARLPEVAGAALDAIAESGAPVTEEVAKRLAESLERTSPMRSGAT